MGEHATLAPSSAEQWGHCAGSVRAQVPFPDLASEQSREGTAAHWVVSEALQAFKTGGETSCSAYEGRQDPDGTVIDEKMVEGAQIMVDSVLATCRRWGLRGDLRVEQRVRMPMIHPNANWGTLDASLYVPEHNALYIWDYKHGHRDCSAENNLQMANYLAGLVDLYQIDGILDQQITVVARIVQPFSYHAAGPVKDWLFKLSDLRPVWNNLQAKAYEALSDSPRLTTGRWCRDCKAVGVCSAARTAGYSFVDVVNAPYEMDAMRGSDLAVERSILQDGLAVAKARLEAIEDELTHRLQKGETDSQLALETSRGREQWTIPPKQVLMLCGQLGIDASKEATKTPRQTRDAAPKEVKPMLEAVMASVTRRPAGKIKLVPASGSKAARAFHTKDERK